jgi:hypothetical protein
VRAIPVCLALLVLLAAGSASAQMYRWVDQDGKVRYGDTPPPGVKASPIKAPPPAASAPAPAPDAKGAKTGPLTPAEQERAFRKRQADAGKAAEKAEADNRKKEERSENCERMREQLRTLESGQRIARVNSGGERYFLEEGQVAQEAANVRRSMQQACD